MVHRIMRFSCRATRRISCMMLEAAAASNPDVGSSKKSNVGFLSRAMARESRRCWPPLSRLHFVSAQPVKPIFLRTPSIAEATFAASPTS
mmetsp:Transcript_48096/g.71672  ORF Transcript_48096/g.71672 Transcript_48096/m.71672 type:complete len:90 (+) Transcript_48096:366-635(+)